MLFAKVLETVYHKFKREYAQALDCFKDVSTHKNCLRDRRMDQSDGKRHSLVHF